MPTEYEALQYVTYYMPVQFPFTHMESMADKRLDQLFGQRQRKI